MVRSLILCLVAISQCGVAGAENVRIFFGNLHSHTSYSDGVKTPRDAYKHARDVAKLDFLAITEHNHKQAGSIAGNHSLYNGTNAVSLMQQAKRFTKDGKFIAIFGQEFSTIGSGNHANVFEVPNVIDQTQVPSGEWKTLLETWIPANLDASGQPALLLLNHPAIDDSPNDQEYGRDDFANDDVAWLAALDARAELINIMNGPSHGGVTPGRPSESEFRRYLNLGFHLAPTADQDNHRPNWGSASDTRTAVLAESLTKPAIMAALRARHVYASEDRDLRIIPRIGGHLIGTRVNGASVPAIGAEMPITIDIQDAEEAFATYQIEVFSDQIGGDDDANIVQTVTHEGNGPVAISGVHYQGGDQYVFLRITQHHDDVSEGDRVWTAPVWFEPGLAGPQPQPGLPVAHPSPPAASFLVDLVAETARVENVGGGNLDLTGWKIVSVHGNQEFAFPAGTTLQPGGAVTVVSGARAENLEDGEIAWGTQNIWRNTGDPGELRNGQGDVVASTP